LTKLINLIYLFDYATIYRAVLSKVNPSTVNSIDFIKKRLEN
jgi:glucose/mannose-6-phosphate isomerase